MKPIDTCAFAIRVLMLASLLVLPFSTAVWAQTGTQTGQAASPSEKPLMLFNGLVRDARIAQRNCDVSAKRAAVNTIQRAMRSVSVHLRRIAGAISRGAGQLTNDGVDLAGLRRSRTAEDAVEAIQEMLGSAGSANHRERLSALQDRYNEFDQWEIFYGKAARMLARLDGAPGDCANKPIDRPKVNCSADEFEPCRYGGPAAGYPRDLHLAIPIRKN